MHFLKDGKAQFGTYKILERDRGKIEEGREVGKEEGILLAKKVLKLSNSGYTISQSDVNVCAIVSDDRINNVNIKFLITKIAEEWVMINSRGF